MRWAIHEPNGRITISGEAGSRRVAEMQGTVGVDLVLHEEPNVSGQTHWVADGALATRPAVPPLSDGAVDLTLPLDTYPDGTEIDVELNTGQRTFADPADPPVIEVPGTYPYRLRPPFPYQDRSGVLEVTDA